MNRSLAFFLWLSAATAVAGPYDQPYALVERGDASQTRREDRVAITKIDGATVKDPRDAEVVAPGKHEITLHYTSARGTFKPEYQVLNLDLAPCTRYRIVARYESTRGPKWEPGVYTEPIGACEKKFGIKAKSGK